MGYRLLKIEVNRVQILLARSFTIECELIIRRYKMKKRDLNKGYILLAIMAAVIVFLEAMKADAYLQTVVSIKGEVLERDEQKPVSANIIVFNSEGGRVYKTKSIKRRNGSFFITGLKPGSNYSVIINCEGYKEAEFIVSVPSTDKYLEIDKTFYIDRLN